MNYYVVLTKVFVLIKHQQFSMIALNNIFIKPWQTSRKLMELYPNNKLKQAIAWRKW